MTTAPLAHTDVVVLDYLAALWAQSDDLSPELRDELMTTVADYISVRRSSPADPLDDATEIVRRLGPPEDLVAAARRGHLPPHLRLPALLPPPPAARPAPTPGGAAEYTAIGLLTAGAFVLPVIAPVAGMLLVSGSPRWTPAEKAAGWIGTAGVAAGGFVLALVFAVLGLVEGGALLLIYLAMCAGSVATGRHLMRKLGQAG